MQLLTRIIYLKKINHRAKKVLLLIKYLGLNLMWVFPFVFEFFITANLA
jgi:hypothetical protein